MSAEKKFRKIIIGERVSLEEGIFFPLEAEENSLFKKVLVNEGTMVDGGIWSNSPVWSPKVYFFNESQSQLEQEVGCSNCVVNGGRGGMLRVIDCQPQNKLLVAGSTDNDRTWEIMLSCRGRSDLVEKAKSTNVLDRESAARSLEQLPCSRGRVEVNLRMRK